MKSGQCPHREILGIAVVPEIENPRESGSGEPRLIPKPVAVLFPQQVGDSPADLMTALFTGPHQCKQRPRSMERSAGMKLTCLLRRKIAVVTFSPPAILPLHGFEPVHRAPNGRMAGIYPCQTEGLQHRPGSIDVIAAPAAKPGATGLLFTEQVCQAPFQRLLMPGLAVQGEKTRAPRGNIAGRRIKECAMIGKRNFIEIVIRIVAVKSRKPAIAGLH